MSHVRTSPYYPQSNGKLERWHKSLKGDCIRVQTPLSQEDALRIVAQYVEQYNTVRLHSAIGYITPKDKLEGRAEQIFAQRDAKLEAARKARREAAWFYSRSIVKRYRETALPEQTELWQSWPSPSRRGYILLAAFAHHLHLHP